MNVAMRGLSGWLLAPALACSLAVGCGDDDGDDDNAPADTGVRDGGGDSATPGLDGGGSTGTLDAGTDSNVAPGDGGTSNAFKPNVITAQASATGNDRFYGVTHDSAGNIFAVGQTSTSTATTADYSFFVAKFNAEGKLDTTFGSNGYAIKNVAEGGTANEIARGIVIQSSGKIVIAGSAEHQVFAADAGVGAIANDLDIYLVRFNSDGKVDTSFGTNGVVVHDVGTGIVTTPTLADGGVGTPAVGATDAIWSLGQTAEGKLVIHTNTRGLGGGLDGGVRTDSDYALLRLDADGKLDTSFGGTGIVRTDFSFTGAGARTPTLLPNGSIVGVGYTTSTVLTGTTATSQQPVLYKVKADGTPDETFATTDPVTTPGVWHDYARPDQKNAEAYGAAPQGDKFVTLGYGPTPSTSGAGTDWVFFRFNGNGSQDKSFGTGGATFLDGAGYADNGRAVIVLPDERVFGVGGGRPAPATPPAMGTNPPSDGMLGLLTKDGQPDPAIGEGGKALVELGGTTDFLWGVDLAPNKKSVAVVGIGGKAADADDEDGVLVIVPLP